MKRPVSVVLLLIWFLTASVKALHALIDFQSMSDYHIFASVHVAPLFFVFGVPMVLLYTGSAYFLFRPRALGYYMALGGIAVASLENITAVLVAVSNLDVVREAFMNARMVRGLETPAELVTMIFTPTTMFIGLGITLGLYAVMAVLVAINKNYFFAHPSMLAA